MNTQKSHRFTLQKNLQLNLFTHLKKNPLWSLHQRNLLYHLPQKILQRNDLKKSILLNPLRNASIPQKNLQLNPLRIHPCNHQNNHILIIHQKNHLFNLLKILPFIFSHQNKHRLNPLNTPSNQVSIPLSNPLKKNTLFSPLPLTNPLFSPLNTPVNIPSNQLNILQLSLLKNMQCMLMHITLKALMTMNVVHSIIHASL